MKDWEKEPQAYDENIHRTCLEPWLSLQELERQILDEEKGYRMINYKLNQHHQLKIQFIKNITSLQIQALESALV